MKSNQKTKKNKCYKYKRFKKLTMETIKMMPFKTEEIEEILDIVGAKTDERGNIVHEDKIVLCEGCGTVINKEKLGSVIPNSEHFICDNPICFYKFYDKIEIQREE